MKEVVGCGWCGEGLKVMCQVGTWGRGVLRGVRVEGDSPVYIDSPALSLSALIMGSNQLCVLLF